VAGLLQADPGPAGPSLRDRRVDGPGEGLEAPFVEAEREGRDDHLAPEVAHQYGRGVLADVDRNRQQALGFDASDAFDERPVKTTSDVAHDHLLV
jgi:hypothetical protein